MQNCNVKSMIYLVIVVLVPLISVGCGPTSEEFSAKVNEADRYKRLSNQQQTEILEKEKKIEEMGNSLRSLNEELFKTQTEKKRALAQQQTNKEHLDIANQQLREVATQLETSQERLGKTEEQLGNIYEELGGTEDQWTTTKDQLKKTKDQLESTMTRLRNTQSQRERTESELGKSKDQLGNTRGQLARTTNQLKQSSELNKKLEDTIKEHFLQITNLEQQEKELQTKYKNLNDHAEALSAQINRYKAQLSEEEVVAKSVNREQQELLESLRRQLESDKVKITELSNRIAVRLDEQLLFDSGKAFIKASGFKVLKRIGTVLKKIHDKHIQIEGHTDNRPIKGTLRRKFPTNWELSVARATSVARYLVDVVNIEATRISSTGFGEFQPVADNKTPEGRQANRRVEFALLPLRTNIGE